MHIWKTVGFMAVGAATTLLVGCSTDSPPRSDAPPQQDVSAEVAQSDPGDSVTVPTPPTQPTTSSTTYSTTTDARSVKTSVTLQAACDGEGLEITGCSCFAAGIEEISSPELIDDVLVEAEDLSQLGAFGFSLQLLAEGCKALASGANQNGTNQNAPSDQTVSELAEVCSASGYFGTGTCRCIAAGAERTMTAERSTALVSDWSESFNPFTAELLSAGCNHLSFEIARADSLGLVGLAPVRVGPDDPSFAILFEGMSLLPAIQAQTATQVFEAVVSTCYLLDIGDTATNLMEYGLTLDSFEAYRGHIATIISAGTVCPEHRDAIAAALEELGL